MSAGAPLDPVALGARADGSAVATRPLQQALDEAGRRGGRVRLPPGTFLSGTLRLRSGTTLELAPGARLLGSPDLADYPPDDRPRVGDRHRHHLLVAEDAEAVTICGGGTIDGNGPAFWEPPEGPRTWIRAKPERVSPMLELRRCRDLRLADVTIAHSPGWTVHLSECDRVWIRGVRLLNPLFGPNTDGFDINGCRDVAVSDCQIECGDDAICLKATHDARSCERVTATNCVIRTNCVAFKLGSETHHDIRQVVFSNSVVHRSTRAFGIWCFDGGTMEDVLVQGIACDTNSGFVLNRPIHLDLRRREASGSGEAADRMGCPVAPAAGRIRNVRVSQFLARTDGRILLTAADGGRLEDIALDGVELVYPVLDDPQPLAFTATSAQFSAHSPDARAARAALVAENVDRLSVRGFGVRWPDGTMPEGWGDDVRAENGSFRQHACRVGELVRHPPPFHAIWGRRLRGGRIDARDLRGSQPHVEPVHLEASTIRVETPS